MPRHFVSATVPWGDVRVLIVYEDKRSAYVMRDGTIQGYNNPLGVGYWSIEDCLDKVERGIWKEVIMNKPSILMSGL